MDILAPVVNTNPIPQKVYIRPVDLTMMLSHSTVRNGEYSLTYFLQIITPYHKQDPNFKLPPSNIHMNSLRDSIMSYVPQQDRPYLKIKSFDNKFVVFTFDLLKWLKEGLTQNPVLQAGTFGMFHKVNRVIPRMLTYDPAFTLYFPKFITNLYKSYVEGQRKETSWFGRLIPESIRKGFNALFKNMIEYSYDYGSNTFWVKVKPVYVVGLVYATTRIAREFQPRDVKNQEKFFFQNVERNVKSFDQTRWIKFLGKFGGIKK